jgi:hypothetical protein
MDKHIYLVGSSDPAIKNRLVLASTPSLAKAHVAQQLLEVKIASSEELFNYVTKGVSIEITERNEK